MDINLDKEWVSLINEARKLGLSINEVSEFLTECIELNKKEQRADPSINHK